ncbi:uncharacterized protein LOC123511402 [Portunus trituberculatus]|uniref:uncharacterized protein LOC123511402 n=1 Tax=Portunus trituberculatus TaxID=210409 RepID=UPI001E1CF55A|nr:uncharacterized protein LOC123511402 [Portunus trituberculatus]XP_045123194.1 uncharacterized protein LOC123511402 [Portunus trituberculatus]XP_045123208.1 uncharacterized protein LOC123511402 [Portunus trituberculatus]XP_045123217.1 uncharacterized protein LOC123511402 [Portunus trituberculatus]
MGDTGNDMVLSIAALGRPFRLGMLYDSRTETLVPGITLWDEATLQNRTEQQQQTSEFHVRCSDSLEEKASALDVAASLKLSILGGLLEAEGAAKYLDNRKTSDHQERVTLQYKCTTRVETMTMDQLGQGKIEHPEVFDHGSATHVVTSIVYGAQAFFVFDRTLSASETENKIQGNVHAVFKKIPMFKMDGKGKLDMTEDEQKKIENFHCTFIGDFLLDENPSTFMDAVRLYQTLPKLLGANGKMAGPLKVKLYPLSKIDRKASRLVRDISISLVKAVEVFFEDLHGLSVKCKDILNSDKIKRFLAFQQQMRDFLNLVEKYRGIIQKEVGDVLPQIRGGGKEERCLLELFNKIRQSPMSVLALRSWLEAKDTQITVFNEYVQAMSDIKFVTEPELMASVMRFDNTYSLCLTISMPSNDSQLERMNQYCDGGHFSNTNGRLHHTDSVPMTGITGVLETTAQQTNSTPIMVVASGFRDFFNANKTRKGISFLITQEFTECNTFHARVRFYKHGRQISDDYKLPSAPEKVKVLIGDTKHDSVTVSWSPPEHGASTITSYVVSCCKDSVQHATLRVTDLNKNQATITGLAANREYEVRVCGECEAGDGPFGDDTVMVKTKPASPPQMLQAMKESPKRAFLTWQPPACVGEGCSVLQYIIKQETDPGHWEEIRCISSSNLSCKVETTKTHPSFKVAACCGSAGVTCDSEASTIDLTKENTSESLKQYVCANSTLIPGDIRIYKPKLKKIYSDPKNNLEKYEFGKCKFDVPEKVIMLVGATGSGKTTLINGMINFIFGVQWKDTFRFKMITEPNAHRQSKSQTTKITSYTLHYMNGFKIPYTLTIVDTPGFGDTSGIERDRQITETVRKFFQTPGTNGISHIDAICLVVNSSLARLTGPQKYIFDQILSVFARDIASNIFLLLTFADGNDPQALSAITEDKIPHQAHFKFNNSALYTFQNEERKGEDHDSDDEGFTEMFWKMGVKSFVKFLNQLKTVKSKSLTLTQEVLNERSSLQTYIEGIQVDIKNGLSTLDRLKRELSILEDHKADIARNKDFEYEVNEEVQVQIPTPVGHYVTNCLHCNRTCHADCAYADDRDKRKCVAMNWIGNCRICPHECYWDLHRNMKYRYETQQRKVKKTYSELHEKYEKATEGKLSAEKLVEEINGEFDALQIKVVWMADCVRKSIERLKEIALRPSPMSTVEYVDILIESEKSEARQGWQARVNQLYRVRDEAEQMQKIANDGFDPFGQYIENLPVRKVSAFSRMYNKGVNYIMKKYNAYLSGKS